MKWGHNGTRGALLQTEMPHFALQKIMFGTGAAQILLVSVHIFWSLWLSRYTKPYERCWQKDVITGRITQYDGGSGYHKKKVSKINVSCLQNTLGQNWDGTCVATFNVLVKLQRTRYSFIHVLIHQPVKIRIKPKAEWRLQFYCIWRDGLNPTPDIWSCHDWRSHSVKLEEQLRSFICEERECCINLSDIFTHTSRGVRSVSAVQATNQISLLNHKKQLNEVLGGWLGSCLIFLCCNSMLWRREFH